MSSKGPCVEDLVLNLALLRSSGVFRRWGLMRGFGVIENVPFKGLVGPEPLLFLSFYFSAIR
jgi:hypothetical protein